jgi:hypothetical protein
VDLASYLGRLAGADTSETFLGLDVFRDSSDGRSPTQADGRLNWPKVGLARA